MQRHSNETTYRTALCATLAVFVLLAGAGCARIGVGGSEPLRALIVDGQNNHGWKDTTPLLEKILVDSGRFTVDVATSPPRGESMEGFRPDFGRYDVVVSNYNGDEWPEETKAAFEDFVHGGGGLVIVHAADNSFSRWEAYNEMIGLGGWGGRNEKSGPYVYYKDGKLVRDTSPGSGGTHGAQWPYPVQTREPDHPIMRGLPDTWLHVADEMYALLRGPAKNMTVLATSPSKVTNRDEPILMTIRYGEGRVFHTVLGHHIPQTECVGFIMTYLRGAEWAATGKVTLTDIPEDFPTADAVSRRELVVSR